MKQKETWKNKGMDHLTNNREKFDVWIRTTIGGDFRWKIPPIKSLLFQKRNADLILGDIEENGCVFPESNLFIEQVRSNRRDGQDE
jgi:hypothetical protein